MSSSPRPREPPSNSRYRHFEIVTYLSPSQMVEYIESIRPKLKAYAYCYHDLDKDKVPHFHCLLSFHNAMTISAVIRSVDKLCFVDDNGKSINTLCIRITDLTSRFLYLTHKNAPDKFQYDDSCICTSDRNFYLNDDNDIDDIWVAMFNDMFYERVHYDVLIKRYGKNFIMNWDKLKSLAIEMSMRKFFS